VLEALPSELTHRFDGIGDLVNREPRDQPSGRPRHAPPCSIVNGEAEG
jgi:hypothetical protein